MSDDNLTQEQVVAEVGRDLKAAESDLLLIVAKEALRLHSFIERLTFTDADDVAAFRNDIIRLEDSVREIDSNARRAQRYFNDVAKAAKEEAESKFLGRDS